MHSWLNGNKRLIKRRVGGTPRSRRAREIVDEIVERRGLKKE